MLDELLDLLMELTENIEDAITNKEDINEETNLTRVLEFEKLRAKIESTFSQLAILFVKIPSLQEKFETLRNIYRDKVLFNNDNNDDINDDENNEEGE